MSRYLLDTNIVSEPLRPTPKILERIRRHLADYAGFNDLQVEDWQA